MSRDNLEWYLFKDGRQYGPYTGVQLETLIQEGRVSPEDLLWNKDLLEWTRADRVLWLPSSSPYRPDTSPGISKEKRQTPAYNRQEQPSSQKKRKLWPVFLGGALLLLLIVGGVTGFNALWGDGGAFTGSTTLEAVTCHGVTEESKPREITDTFTLEDPEIFLAVTVTNAREGSVLAAQWWHLLREEGEQEKEIFLAGYEVELPRGDSQSHFSILRPPFNWSAGEYQVDLLLDDEPVIALPFKIDD